MKTHKAALFAGCFVSLFLVITATQAPASESTQEGAVQKVQMPPPSIISPAERLELRGIFKVSFSWSEVQGASGYHVVLSRDRRFRKIVYENARVAGPACVVDNLGYGTYFYKISSVAADGSEGPFSDVRTFLIAPSPPAGK